MTPVLYWVLAQVLCRRIQALAEKSGVLEELPNGFRMGRHLCRRMAFSDVEKAYDCVCHTTLWTRLHRQGLPNKVVIVHRLQGLYSGAVVKVEWQGRQLGFVAP